MSTVSRRLRRMLDMRECLHVLPHLQSYLDGECDLGTVRRVTAHLEYCRRCGLEFAAYREIKRAMAHREEPHTDAVARLRAFGGQLAGAGPDATAGPESHA